MSLARRLAKPALVLLAIAVLAAALSACAVFKPGSLRLSQPQGIGPVALHFEICTDPGPEKCEPNEDEGQSQYMLGIAVRSGATAPETITAVPVNGAAPIVFTRNEEVSKAIVEAVEAEGGSYPPQGMQQAGYLSAVFTEETGATREWTVDTEFGLPTAADGGSFGGPFTTQIIYGWRKVDDTHPANRPVKCFEPVGEPPSNSTAICGSGDEGEVGTSDLKIGAPPASAAFVGGEATISFPFDFASTATPPPGFNLAASSTLAKANLKLSDSNFFPGAPDPTTHRSPAESRTVTVTVPKNAKPGAYDVTLTAATAQGGTVSQVAKLRVTKPKLKLGKVKLNEATGTATVFVKVPAAGTLTISGKGVAKAKRKAKKAKTVKVPLKPTGQAKAQLAELGKAKVKAKIAFKPTSGIAVKKTKSITLKKG